MNRIERLRELEAAAIPAPWPEAGQEPWENARPMPTNLVLTRPEDARLAVEARNALPELLSLVERLSEVDPVVHIRGRWFTVCCETEGFEDDGDFHLDDCPFLLLEQWKAEA